MNFNFFYDYLIFVPAITFIITVFLKWLFIKIKTWKIDIPNSFWSWWMPSVHSSVVISLTTAVFLKYWIASGEFAIAMSFSLITLYDSINVRFEAWQHAIAINESLWEKKYKESLWHLPSEVFAWSFLGIFIALILYYL